MVNGFTIFRNCRNDIDTFWQIRNIYRSFFSSNIFYNFSGKISNFLRKSTLFTMIFFHIQALIGLIMLFFFSPGFKAAKEAGTLMKDAVSRNTYVEHPTAMIIAAVLLTILNKKFKTNDTLKMSWVVLGFVAIALMLWAFQWSRLFGA